LTLLQAISKVLKLNTVYDKAHLKLILHQMVLMPVLLKQKDYSYTWMAMELMMAVVVVVMMITSHNHLCLFKHSHFHISKYVLILTGNPQVCAQEGPNMLTMLPSYQKVVVLQLYDHGYWISNHQFSLDDSKANDAMLRCLHH
jgi:hypothetical protein